MNKAEYLADWESIKAKAEGILKRRFVLREVMDALDDEMDRLVRIRMAHMHNFLGCTGCSSANRERLGKEPCCMDDRTSQRNNPKPVEAMRETSPACEFYQAGEPKDVPDGGSLEVLKELFSILRGQREPIIPQVQEKPNGRKDN